MQRSDIATATREYCHELGTQFVTGTILTRFIDRAARRLTRETGYNRADATMNIRSGAREYNLNGTTLKVYRARLGTGSGRVRLDMVTEQELDRDDGDWEGGTVGTPTRCYSDGRILGFDPKPRKRNGWVASTSYAVGDIVVPTGSDNGFWYACTTAGTTGGAQPTWPTTISGTVSDNGVVWQQTGYTRMYLRSLQTPAALSNATSVPTWCPVDFHDTIAKLAAYEIDTFFNGSENDSVARKQALYNDYLRDKAAMTSLADGRMKQARARVTVTGYSTFRRR